MKTKITIAISCICLSLKAQPPTGSPPTPLVATNPNQAVTHANFAWYRGGNFNVGPAGNNNIFGTMWNSPIYTKTNGFTRTRLNGDLTTVIQSVNQNVSGYMGLSFNPAGPSFFDNNSPRSMLHIDGPNNTGFSGDWRRWMRTGTYYRENSDAMYVGMKQEGLNRSDAVINWSDDAGAGGGPDALRFIFTSTSDGNGGGSVNPRSAAALNGYEYMRMLPYPYAVSTNSQGTPIGHIGLGPLFDNTAANSPKARLHSHTEDWFENYFQFTNEQSTGMQYNDGLKIGIGGYSNNTIKSGNAYIYNQENRSILFSTNHVAPSQVNISPTDAQITEERMRITSISAPTNLNNNTFAPFGVWNPGNLTNQDVTRVSISHNPTAPITRPLALLHLGYNTGGPLTPTTTDGWRKWMDVGAFIAQGTDNAYFGMKTEPGANNDRQDAVIGWGDNYLPTNVLGQTTGIDKLRIIFTSPESGQVAAGPGAMSTQDGLEFVRYVPFHNISLNVNDPRTGFGDFQNLTPVGTINPGNTIEINSVMNGYNATANTNVTGSYVGSTGASGLRFRDLTSFSIPVKPDSINKIDSTKVLTVDTLGNVVLIKGKFGSGGVGNYCSATTPNPLTGDYEIPMNIYNYYFSGQGTGRTNVGVGLPCNTNLGGKIHAYQLANNFFLGSNLGISVAGRFDNYTSTNAYLGYGVFSNAAGPSSAWNIGIFGTASNAALANFAGYFQGDVYTTGGSTSGSGYLVASDKNIKTNINTMTKNLDVISRLRPVNYIYDNSYAPQLNLNNHKNYGFIAQEVEAILPEVVSTTTVIPTFDSLNNVINPEKVVKALNYDGLIPFAIGGIQELNSKQKEMEAILNKEGLSDAQVKTNVNSFNALSTVKTLSPVKYNFTNANVPQLTFKPNTDYGFIAQQLESVYPELVDTLRIDATYDSLGALVNPSKVLKTVNYKAMSALLVRSIQEQQLTIDSLRNVHSKQDSINQAVQQQLAALASQINSCCSNTSARNGNSTINQVDIELSDKDAIVLNQNVPNPFAEQTTITYNVPTSVAKAQLIFFNANGQIIHTVDIKTRGNGKVNVFASDLSSGLYHYTLVADGKVVDSKKMVRE